MVLVMQDGGPGYETNICKKILKLHMEKLQIDFRELMCTLSEELTADIAWNLSRKETMGFLPQT
jgi:hypothetical protein